MRLRTLLACGLLMSAAAVFAQPDPRMVESARAFLATLSPEQKTQASYPFNSEERFHWFYTPVSRRGISLKEMSAGQRKAAMALLHAGLSEKGFTKAETIRQLENVLRDLEQGSDVTRDPNLYYFTFFGEPTDSGAWGWRYEGHHVSQNWTIVNGKSISGMATTPQFFGANPAEVRSGPMKGSRPLAAEEDLGRSLVKSLTPEQRKLGILTSEAPSNILTTNTRKAAIQEDRGIAYSQLTKDQQGMMLALIEEYLGAQPQKVAQAHLEKIRKDGFDTIKFAWMGGVDPGQGHYYRVQGKTFLIEFDNTQDNANHIHCVWRDFNGDWGEDLLAEHYQHSPHHAGKK